MQALISDNGEVSRYKKEIRILESTIAMLRMARVNMTANEKDSIDVINETRDINALNEALTDRLIKRRDLLMQSIGNARR